MGSEDQAWYLKGCTKGQESEAPPDSCQPLLKTINLVNSSTLARLKIKTVLVQPLAGKLV